MKGREFRTPRIVSYILSFLMTILFIILYMGIGFQLGFFNSLSVLKAIDESGYYDKAYEDLYRNSEEAITGAKLPLSILTDVVTKDYVYMECKNYVDNSLSGQVPSVDSTELKEKLSERMKTYYLSENAGNTWAEEQDVKTVVDKIGAQYEEAVTVELAKEFNDNKSRYERVIQGAVVLSAFLIAMISLLLLKIHRHVYRTIRYIMYSILSSAVIIILAALISVASGMYNQSYLEPDYYRQVISAYLKWDLMLFLYIGGISTIVGIGLIYFNRYLKDRVVNR